MLSQDALDEKSKFIINNLEKKMRKFDIKNFIENYMAGEKMMAYEDLCTQIYEFDTKISHKVFELIKEQCLYYGIDTSYWKDLEQLVEK